MKINPPTPTEAAECIELLWIFHKTAEPANASIYRAAIAAIADQFGELEYWKEVISNEPIRA
jgi:hypothetical protein